MVNVGQHDVQPFHWGKWMWEKCQFRQPVLSFEFHLAVAIVDIDLSAMLVLVPVLSNA